MIFSKRNIEQVSLKKQCSIQRGSLVKQSFFELSVSLRFPGCAVEGHFDYLGAKRGLAEKNRYRKILFEFDGLSCLAEGDGNVSKLLSSQGNCFGQVNGDCSKATGSLQIGGAQYVCSVKRKAILGRILLPKLDVTVGSIFSFIFEEAQLKTKWGFPIKVINGNELPTPALCLSLMVCLIMYGDTSCAESGSG